MKEDTSAAVKKGAQGELGFAKLLRRAAAIRVSGEALTWSRFTGALLLVLIGLLFLSGAFLAFFYSPYPGAAYDSVDYSQYSLPFGQIIRGVHHYAWNLLLVIVVIHLVRTFIAGSYRIPRHGVWISGLLFVVVLPAFMITGDLLPWDQKGYWTTQVRLSIVSSVPVIGSGLVHLLQGGPRTGIVALTRFYVLHIIFLPAVLTGLVALHLYLIAQVGLAGRMYGERKSSRPISCFPDLVNRGMILFMLAALLLVALSHFWPAAPGDPADPTDSTFVPRPEWWVLPLNQLVSIFRGPLMPVGTVVVPMGLLGLLLLLPYLDRAPQADPMSRWRIMLAGSVIGLFLCALTLLGYLEHFTGQ